jgi:hypothetical protein
MLNGAYQIALSKLMFVRNRAQNHSLAYMYLRLVGPTSLQYIILFVVGNRNNRKALMWLKAPPTPSCLE